MYQFGPSQWERGNRSDSMSKSVWGPWQPCLVNIQFKYCISLDYPLLIQLFYCVSIVSGKLVTINHTLIESFEENYSQSAISFSLEDFYFYFFPVKSNLKWAANLTKFWEPKKARPVKTLGPNITVLAKNVNFENATKNSGPKKVLAFNLIKHDHSWRVSIDIIFLDLIFPDITFPIWPVTFWSDHSWTNLS